MTITFDLSSYQKEFPMGKYVPIFIFAFITLLSINANAQGTISGPTSICGTSASYTVSGSSATTGYTWSVPEGMITSGQGTQTVTVSFNGAGLDRVITVTGNGLSASIVVNAYVAVPPSSITGPSVVCPGGSATYTINPITMPGLQSVSWVATNATILSQSNTTIEVAFPTGYTGGQIIVYGIFGPCGAGPAATLSISASAGVVPDAAGTISGETSISPGQQGVTYTIPSIANAINYNWIPPSNANIVSGGNSNSITMNFTSNFAGGHIKVFGSNGSCTGTRSTLALTSTTCASLTPGPISGTTSVCPGQTNVQYSVAPISGATMYLWTLPNGQQQNTTSNTITLNYASNASSGILTVQGKNNTCNAGPASTLNITVKSRPTVTINNPGPACEGQGGSVSFQAQVTDGNIWSNCKWYKNNVLVTDNAPNVPEYVYTPQNPLNAGDKIKCTVNAGNSCYSEQVITSNTITVTTQQPVAPFIFLDLSLNLPGYLCQGDELTFTAAPGEPSFSFTNFQWKLNGAIIPNNNTNTYQTTSFAQGDVVTVTATVAGNCVSSNTSTISTNGYPIAVIPTPNASLNLVGEYKACSGCAITLTASPNDPSIYSYKWYKNNSLISGVTSPSFAAAEEGTYKVKVSQQACSDISDTLRLIKNIKSIALAGQDKVLTIPNNNLSITGSGTDTDGTIEGYIWHKVSGPVSFSPHSERILQINNLPAGDYLFRLMVKDNQPEWSLSDTVSVKVIYPPNNHNWVKTTQIQVPGIKTDNDLIPLQASSGEKSIQWSYFDDLGRPSQHVQVQQSPSGNDFVQPIIYDNYGREALKYLPFVSLENNGMFKNIGFTSAKDYTHDFYDNTPNVAHDNFPFTETVFEPSPLNRIIKQGAPGQAWQPHPDLNNFNDKSIKTKYEANVENEVLLFQYNQTTQTIAPFPDDTLSYYAQNTLYVTRTFDEHNHEVVQYTDKMGKTILKRVEHGQQAGSKLYADTYYIYDDKGNLAIVLPPEGTKQLATLFSQN